MKQEKRKRNYNNSESNRNKRKTIHDKIPINNINKSSVTCFEDLSNEVIYEIFDCLNNYHIYKSFFDLNQRFNNLLIDSSSPININLFSISKSNFQHYKSNIILPNKQRIISLHLSNALIIDDLLSPEHIISKFIRLEKLVLEQIKIQQLENILKHAISLPNLNSLIINPTNSYEHSDNLYPAIFRLPKVRYCKIKFSPESLSIAENHFSNIEYLVIDHGVYYDILDYLLSYVPQLRYLYIQCLDGVYSKRKELVPIELKYLKYVSIKFHFIYFNQFEKMVKDYFSRIEILHISGGHDEKFLDANRWEQIISNSLLNLHEFYLKYSTPENYKNEFTSSFWIERQCLCIDEQHRGYMEIFFTKDLNRKKSQKIFEIKYCNTRPYEQRVDINSVNHIHIYSIYALEKCVNYFSNITDLTFHFHTDGYISRSIGIQLNRIIPLTQLTKLFIDGYNVRFNELIEILIFTINLEILKFSYMSINDSDCESIQQTEKFKSISKRNNIKNIIFDKIWSLEKVQLLVALCPRLEYLQTDMDRKKLNLFVQFLLLNTNQLFFLHITNVPQVCLREVKRLIKLEKLLENYFIEYFDRDLYLWW